jgi:hypothetical protein
MRVAPQPMLEAKNGIAIARSAVFGGILKTDLITAPSDEE